MGQRPITPLGQQMIDSLPTVLRGSYDYQGVLHACSRELDRLAGRIEQVRAQLNPATADLLLGAWEMQVKLPVGGMGATVAQRQAKVLGQLQKVLGAAEGREWTNLVTDLIGSGWTYEEHIPGDPTSPPENTLRITLPYPPDGSAYNEALAAIREVTAAHLEIEFLSAGGFILDESQADLQELTN